jgi:hypothetical protein
MGSQLTSDLIRNALDYWYERDAFTATLSVGAGAAQPLFPALSAWNPANGARQIVSLESLAATQDPNLRFSLAYDGYTSVIYGDELRSGLGPSKIAAPAAANLSLVVTNTGTAATSGTQVVYTASIWTPPVAYKVLHGYGLTAAELEVAKQAHLATNPVAQTGVHPIPISAVIERTYENRLLQSPWQFQGPSPTATTAGAVIAQVNAQPPGQDLLVLRSIGAEADEDYGITLSWDRDNQLGQGSVDAALLSLDQPLDLFVPAKTSLTFHLQAAVPPPGPTPIRIEVWHVSLSAILRTRMGLVTLADLEGLYGQQGGQDLYYKTLAGVR